MFHYLCCGTRTWTDWDDGLHPSIQSPTVNFVVIESPRIKVFFTALFFNFGFSFLSYFLSVSLLFSSAKSKELSLWCSFSVEILVLLIFSLFTNDISDSLFRISFCKNTGATTWFFSVRDFLIYVLIIFSFFRWATSSFKDSIRDMLSVMKFFSLNLR